MITTRIVSRRLARLYFRGSGSGGSSRDRRRLRRMIAPPDDHHGRWDCLLRSGRWGGCVDCPRRNGVRRPDLCMYTSRYDHLLTKADK